MDENYAAARRRYRAVLKVRIDREDLAGVATVRQMLAQLALVQGDVESARDELTAVLSIVRDLGDYYRQAHVHLDLGEIDEKQQRYDAARAQYRAALGASRTVQSQYMEANAYARVAALDVQMGDLEAARVGFGRVLQLAAGAPETQATAHRWLGSIEAGLGDTSQALTHYQYATDLYRGLGDAEGLERTKAELDELGDQ